MKNIWRNFIVLLAYQIRNRARNLVENQSRQIIITYSMLSGISSAMKGITSLWNVTWCSLVDTNVLEQPAGAILYTEAEAAG